MIEAFKHQLDNAEIVIKDQQAKSNKDKQLLELNVIK